MERSFSRLPRVLEVPDLVQGQRAEFARFLGEGIGKLLREISPVVDPAGRLKLSFLDYRFGEITHSIEECKERELTYAAPWYILLRLEKEEPVEQWVYFGNFPMMTERGTFILNGAERTVVNQLIRAPGVYFLIERGGSVEQEGAIARLIPDHGGWIELGGLPEGHLYIKLAGRYKIPVTALLQASGYSKEELLKLFPDEEARSLLNTFEWADRDYNKLFKKEQGIINKKEALSYLSVKLHPGGYPSPETASTFLKNLLENTRYFDMGEIGRYKLNRRLGFYRKRVGELLDKLKKLKLEGNFLLSRLEKAAEDNSDEVLPLLKELKQLLEGKASPKARELSEELATTITKLEDTRLSREDLVEIVRCLIRVSRGQEPPDDLDYLGNRRVRTVADQLYNQLRIAFLGLEHSIKEQMSLIEPKQAVPKDLVNIRLIQTALKEAFTTSSLSQFLDQTNPLAELTHKRRLSALGPGGLSREHAGFEVRDVHYSHYGRICPIETPEGSNIGLITSMAIYARRNPLGLLETPYRRVVHQLENTNPELIGRKLRQILRDEKGRFVANPTVITEKIFERLSQLPPQFIPIVPYVSSEIVYLSPDKEDEYKIAPATVKLNERGEFLDSKVEVRYRGKYLLESPLNIDFVEISPQQILGVSASLIPFVEHDDANRALMGANMQRQAVPLLRPQAPLIQTGMEEVVARNSGQVIRAKRGGIVSSVTSGSIVIRTDEGEIDEYPLVKFERTNQGTCITQRPVVSKGQRVKAGDLLADGSATDGGRLALGQNLLVAFMSWEGYNFEDAIVVNESVAWEDRFTSIHIEKYEIDAKETKLGPEEITREIPDVGEERLKNLDEEGIIRVGAEVEAGDILVGKIAYKGETELTAEERLLSVIFGEKAREVKDISLRLPHGEKGKVIKVKSYHRDQYADLGPGVIKRVRVWVAQKRKLAVGDKLAGRHGNKGVVSIIVPAEDMPFLPDGRPVEVILNPIGVPSRMNLGQILETHLGAAAHVLGFKAICPPFEGASISSIEDALAQAWLVGRAGALKWEGDRPVADIQKAKEWVWALGYDGEKVFSPDPQGAARLLCLRLWLKDQGIDSHQLSAEEVEEQVKKLAEQGVCPPVYGKVYLRDGRTGEVFDHPVTVGQIYLMKLIHLVEDKIHARSLGPYSLITQQPLGGRAQFGGQRFGEMEVWALEAYGAAHTLQEMLTVKSDDVPGRNKTYESLIKGEDIIYPGIPESFKVLALELKSLGLNIEILPSGKERAIKELPEGL